MDLAQRRAVGRLLRRRVLRGWKFSPSLFEAVPRRRLVDVLLVLRQRHRHQPPPQCWRSGLITSGDFNFTTPGSHLVCHALLGYLVVDSVVLVLPSARLGRQRHVCGPPRGRPLRLGDVRPLRLRPQRRGARRPVRGDRPDHQPALVFIEGGQEGDGAVRRQRRRDLRLGARAPRDLPRLDGVRQADRPPRRHRARPADGRRLPGVLPLVLPAAARVVLEDPQGRDRTLQQR